MTTTDLSKKLVFSERSIFDDALFWNSVSNRFGSTNFQDAAYKIVWKQCAENIALSLPDAFVYIRTPSETCFLRKQMRDRIEERGGTTTQEYLNKLIDSHESAFIGSSETIERFDDTIEIRRISESLMKNQKNLHYYAPYLKNKIVFVLQNNEESTLDNLLKCLSRDHFEDIKEICLSGCIAAGKSWFLRLMEERGFKALKEPIELWKTDDVNLLESFNIVPDKTAFELQIVIFISRVFNRVKKI